MTTIQITIQVTLPDPPMDMIAVYRCIQTYNAFLDREFGDAIPPESVVTAAMFHDDQATPDEDPFDFSEFAIWVVDAEREFQDAGYLVDTEAWPVDTQWTDAEILG